MLGQTQEFDDLIPFNRRKIHQKVFNGITALEVIKQVLDRYTTAGKDGFAALDIGRNCDHLVHRSIVPNAGVKLNRQTVPSPGQRQGNQR